MKWSQDEIIFMKENYPLHGVEYCSKKLNRSKSSISNMSNRLNLVVNYDVKIKNMSNNRINSDDFIDLNNENSVVNSYILGLLWADGYIGYANNPSKTPQIKHSCVIYDSDCFNKIFKQSGDWGNYTFENKKSIGKNTMSVNWTSNRKLGEYLIKNDYRNKNKSPFKILSNIPNDMKKYFFRGYFDGDGCVTYQIQQNKYESYGIYFSSSIDQNWDFLIHLMEKLDIKNYKIRKNTDDIGSYSQFYFKSNESSFKFLNYIYDGNLDICLKRKYDKYLKLKSYLKLN